MRLQCLKQWVLIPFFHSSEFIAEKIKENKEFYQASKNVERLYFYGAGCSSNEMNQIVKTGLSLVYTNSLIMLIMIYLHVHYLPIKESQQFVFWERVLIHVILMAKH